MRRKAQGLMLSWKVQYGESRMPRLERGKAEKPYLSLQSGTYVLAQCIEPICGRVDRGNFPQKNP